MPTGRQNDVTTYVLNSPSHNLLNTSKSLILDKRGLGPFCRDHFALSPQKRGGLLATGTGGGRGRKSEGSTADTARKRPERPWTAARTMESVKAVFPRHCPVTSALHNCCFNCRAGQSHRDNVHCTAVEEQPEAKEVQLSQPSSTSLLMISFGLT